MATEGDDAELLQLIADSRLTGYFAAASLCILLYDHIICFPKEVSSTPSHSLHDLLTEFNAQVQLMWSSRWGLAKGVYLWNRYFSLIAISLNTSVIVREIATECIGWLKVQGITSTIIIGTVDFVLMLRVWIMYARPRLLVWLFLGLGIAEVTAMVAVDFVAYGQMTRASSFLPPPLPLIFARVRVLTCSQTEYVHLGPILPGCYAYNVPRFLTVYAAVPLFVTFVMFVMTLYKCCSTLRVTERSVMPVWRLFLRDGVLWFLAVFAAAGAALLIWTMRRETLKQLLVVPALVVYSTVASRTLLNIKAILAEEAQNQSQAGGSQVKSGEMVFAHSSVDTAASPIIVLSSVNPV
ncbi:hypothetical protein MSAN_00862700 [Mycena sanguinolenta]|uniref:DUF6533 domain-containing protein n=1 Tax=Mycena sanguinolenta TaxID=230812 RepID=A0A8H6YX00_9AGAR|nr:hypothetical protein MSAN_00862700 [Mycena sanguinolenta]